MLKVSERRAGDVTILDLEGNIIMGGGSALLRETIVRLHGAGRKKILLNFANVKYIDSSGIGELVAGSETIGGDGAALKLMSLPPKIEEVFTLSSLLPLFEVFQDEAQALKSFRSAP